MLEQAQWVVFAMVLANQAGVPVFAAPALLAVGALAWTGDVNVGMALAGSVAASLCADLGWYTVGRWRGHWAIAALKRVSRGTRGLVDNAQRLFLTHDRAVQLGARFLPELNPVAAALAGVAGVSLRRFLPGAAVSAAIWASTWSGAGYLIASATWSDDGSGVTVFAAIVAAFVVAPLSVLTRPAARAIIALWRSPRTRTPPQTSDASRHAEYAVGSKRSPC
jgi:membrane protein DedA with SNARE-associated domain